MNTMRTAQFTKIVIVMLVLMKLIVLVVPSAKFAQALDTQSTGSQLADEKEISAGEGLQSTNAAGTPYLVKDIFQGSGYWLSEFTVVNTEVFFLAYKPMSPNIIHELWKSDGTESGTVMVKRFITLSAVGGSVGRLSDINGTLFFAATDETHGEELWKSDGTETGTVLVKDINPGKDSSNIDELTNVDGSAFFRAVDGSHSDELWKSDGTESGTMMVKDINESGGSWPRYFTPMS
jgi:ELWxxDGT repeat protein